MRGWDFGGILHGHNEVAQLGWGREVAASDKRVLKTAEEIPSFGRQGLGWRLVTAVDLEAADGPPQGFALSLEVVLFQCSCSLSISERRGVSTPGSGRTVGASTSSSAQWSYQPSPPSHLSARAPVVSKMVTKRLPNTHC